MSTAVDKPKGKWKFSNPYLSDPSYLNRIHNCIRSSTLLKYSGDTDVQLQEIQKHIDYDQHPSCQIFTDLVPTIRKFSINVSWRADKAKKRKEEVLINNLVESREAYNNAANPSDRLTSILEDAQQALMMSQMRRSQAAASLN